MFGGFDVGFFVFGDRGVGVDDVAPGSGVEFVRTSRGSRIVVCSAGVGGTVAASSRRVAMAGRSLRSVARMRCEDVEGFAGVVGVGDDTDQVLVASAGGTDIQAAGRWSHRWRG